MYYDDEKLERRCLKAAEFRVDEEEPKITGYAALFNTWTDIGGWFRDAIQMMTSRSSAAPTAFRL